MSNRSSSLLVSDGVAVFNGDPLDIGPLRIERELDRGANGVVFVVTDPLIQRRLAVKFWLTLRRRDKRTKAVQGLEEARKQWIAQHDNVARLYFSGYASGVFFTVMEFVDGSTLKNWLADPDLPLGSRCYMAERILDIDRDIRNLGIIHGDPHWKNIIISPDFSPPNYFEPQIRRWHIKFLDFGTSFYTGKAASLKRHFNVLEETLNHCIHPFRLEELKAHPRPIEVEGKAVYTWIKKSLFSIRAGLYQSGYPFVGWPLYRKFGTYELTTDGFDIDISRAIELIKLNIENGALFPSRKRLGDAPEWGPFDGRTAEREFD